MCVSLSSLKIVKTSDYIRVEDLHRPCIIHELFINTDLFIYLTRDRNVNFLDSEGRVYTERSLIKVLDI